MYAFVDCEKDVFKDTYMNLPNGSFFIDQRDGRDKPFLKASHSVVVDLKEKSTLHPDHFWGIGVKEIVEVEAEFNEPITFKLKENK